MPIAAPLSPLRRFGSTVVVSGQIGWVDGVLAGPGVSEQTSQALRNIANLQASEGLSTAHVVKTAVFLTDMRDYTDFNDAYRKFSRPASRSLGGGGFRAPRERRLRRNRSMGEL